MYLRCKTTKAGSAQSDQVLEQTTNTQVKSDYLAQTGVPYGRSAPKLVLSHCSDLYFLLENTFG